LDEPQNPSLVSDLKQITDNDMIVRSQLPNFNTQIEVIVKQTNKGDAYAPPSWLS